MIKFERYPHVNDLFDYYSKKIDEDIVYKVIKNGVSNAEEAEVFSRFVWKVVEKINEDEERGNVVLGSNDNTEMLPDINYEITKYMKKSGFYSVWEKVSDQEIH